MSDARQLITPQTKVSDLLKEYPELQELLIEIAPAFKKLRNPVLLRTVARVTTLAQAARVGNVPVDELIQKLRKAVGQPDAEGPSDTTVSDGTAVAAPPWFATDKIVSTLDARRMIRAGEQPIGPVLRNLDSLKPGEIYELITPFEPAPLMDKAITRGFVVWCRKVSTDEYRTAFSRG